MDRDRAAAEHRARFTVETELCRAPCCHLCHIQSYFTFPVSLLSLCCPVPLHCSLLTAKLHCWLWEAADKHISPSVHMLLLFTCQRGASPVHNVLTLFTLHIHLLEGRSECCHSRYEPSLEFHEYLLKSRNAAVRELFIEQSVGSSTLLSVTVRCNESQSESLLLDFPSIKYQDTAQNCIKT